MDEKKIQVKKPSPKLGSDSEASKVNIEKIADAWANFVPKVPLVVSIASRKAIRQKSS